MRAGRLAPLKGASVMIAGKSEIFGAGLAMLFAGGAAFAGGGEPPNYSVQFITPDIDANNASAMNNAGDVVGTTPYSRAWVSRGGESAVLLPLPLNTEYSFANDINEGGMIVGSVNTGPYSWMGKAAAWIPNGEGGYDILQYGTLPGHPASSALALNNVGDVVGYSFTGMFRIPVRFIAPGNIEDLSATGIFDPVSINDQRVKSRSSAG
jgi:uncharacterized membrane protein